ncbi:hypothetical protein [Methylocystis sp.]|uniref:hypothetical protein n=1 Tax=Methylocystis sp. TaxID=1911079 RepID=UPI003DA6163B
MSLASDLLAQARALAANEPRRPKQASLRRAVSAAYYALFHLLVEDAARQLSAAQPPGLRAKLQRAFSHGDMKNVCLQFGGVSGRSPQKLQALLSAQLAPGLVAVARAFVDLQEARHAADYDVSTDFNRADALSLIQKVEAAFSAWRGEKNSSDARVFLIALLINERWHK